MATPIPQAVEAGAQQATTMLIELVGVEKVYRSGKLYPSPIAAR